MSFSRQCAEDPVWPKAERLLSDCFAAKRTLILARRSAVSDSNQPVTGRARATPSYAAKQGFFSPSLQTCTEVRERST